MTVAEAPIFVRGLSRSGGTLMVTILDAHPDVAMSYELYPTLLETEGWPRDRWRELADRVAAASSARKAKAVPDHRGVQTFIGRCERGGIDHVQFADLVHRHLNGGLGFDTNEERLRFIGSCCRVKMRAENKSRWGLKCNNQYEAYLGVWPQACFLNMVRDGRDVLASQLNTGSFNNTPAEVGTSWSRTHRRFREFADRGDVRAYAVRYESLVSDPEAELQRIGRAIGLSPDPAMLQYYKKDLTIYHASHLSLKGISGPVNSSSLGRWRRDLNPQQLEEFYSKARHAMVELGYEIDNAD